MSKAIGKALRNSTWQSLGGLSVTALNFVLTLVYARVLGPGGFGSLVTSQAQVLIWTLFVDLGLTAGLIASLTDAERRHEGPSVAQLVRWALGMRFLGALLGAGVIGFFVWREAVSRAQALQDLAFAPYLFAFACQQTGISYATFRGRQGTANLCVLLGTLLSVALSATLVLSGAAISTLLFFQSLWGFLIAALIFLSLGPTPSPTPRAPASAALRLLWSHAWPYAAVFAVMTIWSRADQIATTRFLGTENGGQYGLASRLVAIPVLLAASVAFATFPDMQRIGRDAPWKLPLYAGTSLKILARYGLPFSAAFLLGVELVIAPVVPKFWPALHLLLWFAPGVWAYWLHSFAINAFWGLRRYREIVAAHLFALVVYLAALMPLVRWGGNRGTTLAYDLFGFALLAAAVRAMRKAGALAPDFRLWGRFSAEEAALWASIRAKLAAKLG